MQLYAFDQNHRVIAAKHADRKRDYFCLECQRVVWVRGGLYRQNHFYHLEKECVCRQKGKTLIHLETQLYLEKALPSGQTELEVRFPEIGRVADVVWHERQIIFEVQCSPISPCEVLSRNRDYARLGFQVVWIFHDQRYNQKRVTAAELALKGLPYYFANIDQEGKGFIYDQIEKIENGYREILSEPILVFFDGDLNDLFEQQRSNRLSSKALPLKPPLIYTLWSQLIVRPYYLMMQIFMEKSSRI